MNDLVRQSVESRKVAFSSFNVTEKEDLDLIDDYFKRLSEFAQNYDDVMKFEEEFAKSPLASEYTDLLVKVMNNTNKSDLQSEKDEILSDASEFARRKINQESYDKLRDIPVIGNVMEAKQHFDFFNKFRKKDK